MLINLALLTQGMVNDQMMDDVTKHRATGRKRSYSDEENLDLDRGKFAETLTESLDVVNAQLYGAEMAQRKGEWSLEVIHSLLDRVLMDDARFWSARIDEKLLTRCVIEHLIQKEDAERILHHLLCGNVFDDRIPQRCFEYLPSLVGKVVSCDVYTGRLFTIEHIVMNDQTNLNNVGEFVSWKKVKSLHGKVVDILHGHRLEFKELHTLDLRLDREKDGRKFVSTLRQIPSLISLSLGVGFASDSFTRELGSAIKLHSSSLKRLSLRLPFLQSLFDGLGPCPSLEVLHVMVSHRLELDAIRYPLDQHHFFSLRELMLTGPEVQFLDVLALTSGLPQFQQRQLRIGNKLGKVELAWPYIQASLFSSMEEPCLEIMKLSEKMSVLGETDVVFLVEAHLQQGDAVGALNLLAQKLKTIESLKK